jgi:hypothetical protein
MNAKTPIIDGLTRKGFTCAIIPRMRYTVPVCAPIVEVGFAMASKPAANVIRPFTRPFPTVEALELHLASLKNS